MKIYVVFGFNIENSLGNVVYGVYSTSQKADQVVDFLVKNKTITFGWYEEYELDKFPLQMCVSESPLST
ncbi:hypothetical protein E308F_29620 [Moorella sp. E308F]|nr:hypothetical protein E308F_29620 [Moorella sp. E308F]